MEYKPIIGLEIHVQPKTKSKMFCRCSADIFGAEPNTRVCPVCLGLPGALPVVNKAAIEKTILLGLALNCQISSFSKFDRKNYFYPDLPKGYQISQYDKPIATNGSLKFPLGADQPLAGKIKSQKSNIIRIRRVHVEEDTGKLIHKKGYSLVDFNRSGMPLIEVVTEPDLRSAREVYLFLKRLQLLIRHLGISGADMEKGTMRLEPNISLRELKTQNSNAKTEEKYPDYKVEIKNINSFKFAEKAVVYEISRQLELVKQGERIKQETRGWDEKKGITTGQRGKEEAQDYRYFPEPDIPPLEIKDDWIKEISRSMPELLEQKSKRYEKEFKLPKKYVDILVSNKPIADYLEAAVVSGLSPLEVANLVINRPELMNVPPDKLKGHITKKKKEVVSDESYILEIIKKVVDENPKPVRDFKNGKETAIRFLLGQVMKKSRGKADPQIVEKLLKDKLGKKL